jgi:hypothetical protein
LKIIGFKVLIPVKEPWVAEDEKDLSIYKHQFTRLAWTSELVCHSRPYLAKLDLGDFLAKCMKGEHPKADNPDLKDRQLVPHYSKT